MNTIEKEILQEMIQLEGAVGSVLGKLAATSKKVVSKIDDAKDLAGDAIKIVKGKPTWKQQLHSDVAKYNLNPNIKAGSPTLKSDSRWYLDKLEDELKNKSTIKRLKDLVKKEK